MKRRHFFKTSTLASVGFLISAYLPISCNNRVLGTESWEPNFYLRVDTNFDSYDLLRMDETPEIEVHLVDSNDFPSGAGEPGVPGVAPALLNALFAATGERPIVGHSAYSIA